MGYVEKSLFANDGIVCDKNYIWYLANEYSAVIQVERLTGNARVLFVVREYFEVFAFRSIVKYKDRILLFPFKGNEFVEYDMNSGAYVLKGIPSELEGKNWCAQYFQDNSDIYFYFQSSFIVKYNCEQDKWSIYDRWKIDGEIKCLRDESKHWFGFGAYDQDDYLYFQLYRDDRVACLNKISEEISIISVNAPSKDGYFEMLSFVNGDLWAIFHFDDKVSKLLNYPNNQLDKYSEICDLPNGGIDLSYSQIVLVMNNVWVLPGGYDKGWRVSKDGSSVEEILDMAVVDKDDLKPVWGRDLNYGRGTIVDGIYVNMNSGLRRIVEIDTVHEKYLEYDIKQNELYRIWELAGCEIVVENHNYSLDDYLIHACEL